MSAFVPSWTRPALRAMSANTHGLQLVATKCSSPSGAWGNDHGTILFSWVQVHRFRADRGSSSDPGTLGKEVGLMGLSSMGRTCFCVLRPSIPVSPFIPGVCG